MFYLAVVRFNFLLYPKARQKFESNGLLERIEQGHDSGRLPYITGFNMDFEVVQAIREMQREGYFETLGNDKAQFQRGLQLNFCVFNKHKRVHYLL